MQPGDHGVDRRLRPLDLCLHLPIDEVSNGAVHAEVVRLLGGVIAEADTLDLPAHRHASSNHPFSVPHPGHPRYCRYPYSGGIEHVPHPSEDTHDAVDC